MKNKNDFVEKVKELPTKEKLLYGGSILAALGFFLPLLNGMDGKAFNIPYGWVLFLISLSVPTVYLFCDYKKDKLVVALSEVNAAITVSGLIIMTRLSGLMGFGMVNVSAFDIIGAGWVLIMIGSITQLVSSFMDE